MRITFLCLIIGLEILCGFSCFSQEAESYSNQRLNSSLSFSLGGAAGYYSLNYSIYYRISNVAKINVIAGIGSWRMVDVDGHFNPDIFIPVIPFFLIGKSHNLAVGIGPVFISRAKVEFESDDLKVVRENTYNGCLMLGYRYVTKSEKWFCQLSFTPIMNRFKRISVWGGLSFGYNIRRAEK